MPQNKHRSRRSDLAEPLPSGTEEAISKSARKRQAHALQDLGLALSRLPADQRQALEMPEELREAIDDYLTTRSNEGRRRQLQFVGKLLRRVDPTPLVAAVERFHSGHTADTERLHLIERWRDALISDDQALTRWMAAHPETDIQQLRSLIRAARSEDSVAGDGQRQPRSHRKLFRFLRRTLEAAEST